jgi:ankyrin repeat protein
LHWAAKYASEKTVAALIEHGADVNATNDAGNTPLHWAAKYASEKTVAALIEHGADVHATNDAGNTPLHRAAGCDNTEKAIALIERKADVNATNNDGGTPLHIALWNGHKQTAIALIERGADVNARHASAFPPLGLDGDFTSLHLAVIQCDTETAIALIEHGADINAANIHGETPLHRAAIKGDTETAIALIERGVNPKYRSPLISIMERLDWWTDLHTAVISNNLNKIRNLEYIPSETSPFDIAIMIGNIDAVRALIDRGIKYDKDKCLRTATYSNRHELAQLFLEKGANPLSTNKIGQNAFHFAAARGNANIMKIFVDNIRKNNAAISIQRGFRSGLFKKDKANSTQEHTPPPSLGGPTP